MKTLTVADHANMRNDDVPCSAALSQSQDAVNGASASASRFIAMVARMMPSTDADDCITTLNRLIEEARKLLTTADEAAASRQEDLEQALLALIESAEEVIDCWSTGDLAGAVNGLEEAVQLHRHLVDGEDVVEDEEAQAEALLSGDCCQHPACCLHAGHAGDHDDIPF